MAKTLQSKSPAFQFYAQDWLADFNVRCLTYEQKGIYIELLAMSWIEPLTSDLDKLAIAMRLQKDSLAIIINQFFYKEGDFFYNKKLEKYRAEKIKFIKNKQKAGKVGADKRWSKTKTKPKQTYGTPIADPMANDSSLSLTSSSTLSLTSNNISKDIQEIVDCFKNSFNQEVRVISEKRKKHIKARLKMFSLEEVKLAIENFASSPFHTGDNDRGWVADLDFIIRSDENIEKGLKLNDVQITKSSRKERTQERCILIDGLYFTERERDEILEKQAVDRDEQGYPRFKNNWLSLVSFKL